MLASVYDPAGGAKQVVFTDDSRLSDARTPSAHTHVKADVTDFSHTHVKADITDFSHTHTVSEVTDFPSTMPPAAHEHAAGDITSGTMDADRLPTVPLTKGGTGQTTAAKGLYALINGATAITADNVEDDDYLGLDDISAVTGKKIKVSELKKLTSQPPSNLVYQEFVESGTWTAPNDIVNNQITVLCCGGGGAGGFGGTSSINGEYPQGGGGGSGYISIETITITPGTSYNLVIGAGGTAPSDSVSSPTNGGRGGTTSFGGSLVTAVGGYGGYGTGNGGNGNAGGGGGKSDNTNTGAAGGNGDTYGGGGGAGSFLGASSYVGAYGKGGDGGTYGGGGAGKTKGIGGAYGGNGGDGYTDSINATDGTFFADSLIPYLQKLLSISASELNFCGKADGSHNLKRSGGGGYGGQGGWGY